MFFSSSKICQVSLSTLGENKENVGTNNAFAIFTEPPSLPIKALHCDNKPKNSRRLFP